MAAAIKAEMWRNAVRKREGVWRAFVGRPGHVTRQLSRASTAAQLEPPQILEKEQPEAQRERQNLQAGAAKVDTPVSLARTADITKTIAVWAGVVAIAGGTYLLAPSRKPAQDE